MPATIEKAPGSVLLLGNHLPSLAAARSLTAAGYRVIAGDGGEFSTVRHSRDCAEVWDHPRISREGEFLAAGSWHMDGEFHYRAGVRYAWTTGDLHGLRKSRATGHISRSAALRWLAGSMRSAVRADVHATWSLRDPLPTLAILAQWLPVGPWKRMPLRDRPDDDLARDGAAS